MTDYILEVRCAQFRKHRLADSFTKSYFTTRFFSTQEALNAFIQLVLPYLVLIWTTI